jgi:hypothetical protein
MLPTLPSNEKNSSEHHNSYNKGPNLAFFSFMESPSNFLLTIKFPKNHITSSYYRNLPKIAKAIFGIQRALGVKGLIKRGTIKFKVTRSYQEQFCSTSSFAAMGSIEVFDIMIQTF